MAFLVILKTSIRIGTASLLSVIHHWYNGKELKKTGPTLGLAAATLW
jgi:hypothetical protein